MKKLVFIMIGILFSAQVKSMGYFFSLIRSSFISFVPSRNFHHIDIETGSLDQIKKKDNKNSITKYESEQNYSQALNLFKADLVEETKDCLEKFNKMPQLPVSIEIPDTCKNQLQGLCTERLELFQQRNEEVKSCEEKLPLTAADYKNQRALLQNPFVPMITTHIDKVYDITSVDRTGYGGLYQLFLYVCGYNNRLPLINPLYPVGAVSAVTLACCWCLGTKDTVKAAGNSVICGLGTYGTTRLYNRFVEFFRLQVLKDAIDGIKTNTTAGMADQDHRRLHGTIQNKVDAVGYEVHQLNTKVDTIAETVTGVKFTVDGTKITVDNIHDVVHETEKKVGNLQGNVGNLIGEVAILHSAIDQAHQKIDNVIQNQNLIQVKQDEILAGNQELRIQTRQLDTKVSKVHLQLETLVEKTVDVPELKEYVQQLQKSSDRILSEQQIMKQQLTSLTDNSELCLATNKRLETSFNRFSIEQKNSFAGLEKKQNVRFTTIEDQNKEIKAMLQSSFSGFGAMRSFLVPVTLKNKSNREEMQKKNQAAQLIQNRFREKYRNRKIVELASLVK